MRKLKDLTDSEKLEIINQRKIGITEKEISKKFDISLRQYYNLLKLNNIEQKSKLVRYKFNEDYFETIDTEDKAYFLGFIVADGNINKNNNSVRIIQKETDILYEFKKFVSFASAYLILVNSISIINVLCGTFNWSHISYQ